MPPSQHFIEVMIPSGVTYEAVSPAHLPGWDHPSAAVAKRFGAAWQTSRRSLLLLAPGVVARMERNILINPDHEEIVRIAYGLHQSIWWDARLFTAGRGTSATGGLY